MKLFVYDHCPYCVKARMILGLKNIDFELVTLLNDDEKTPISMIGQKMVPILQKTDGSFMAESLDIIEFIDENYGNYKAIIANNQPSEALNNWFFNSSEYLYPLAMPRWCQAGLEEFKTKGAIDYFTNRKEMYIGSFAENLENSDNLIKKANQDLLKLDKILKSHFFPNEDNQISIDDVNLFASLRSLSIVKGLEYPENVQRYRQEIASLCKINLHDDIAI